MDEVTEGRDAKSFFDCLCNVIWCCSCSRRTRTTAEEKRRRNAGRCVPQYCIRSPATILVAVDAAFLFAMIWVLYDAAQVMRTRYDWWWIVPAILAAPAFVTCLLKLRYVRRLCDQRWREDIIWNARIILLPLLGALCNTFMVACWLLCAPLYVIEMAYGSPALASLFTLDEYEAELRNASANLLMQPSSLVLMLLFVISLVTAALISARHRRVMIRFTVDAMERGMDVEGSQRVDTSLLTRAELEDKNTYNATVGGVGNGIYGFLPQGGDDRTYGGGGKTFGNVNDLTRQSMGTQSVSGTMESLYMQPIRTERAEMIMVMPQPVTMNSAASTGRVDYAKPTPAAMVAERTYGTTSHLEGDWSDDNQQQQPPPSPYRASMRGNATARAVAKEAQDALQRRNSTLERFDATRSTMSTIKIPAPATQAPASPRGRTPRTVPSTPPRSPRGRQPQQPPPPNVNPPPPKQPADDDESEHLIDSPREIERLRRPRSSSRTNGTEKHSKNK